MQPHNFLQGHFNLMFFFGGQPCCICKPVVYQFPSNNFREQEKGSDEEIAEFCKVNYGITFPLAKKSVVIKTAGQNKIFEWLTDKEKNGWLSEAPTWNFYKCLINEEGVLTHFFEAAIEPTGEEITEAIQS